MNLSSVDLNLLVVLEALLLERSVTRAARRLGLSQPATSSALNRLRAHFGDPLFVRSTGGIEPTSRALALEPSLRAALDAVRTTLAPATAFEPQTAVKTFRLTVPDSLAALLIPRALARLEREAPSVDLLFAPFSGTTEESDALLREGSLDAVIVRDVPDRALMHQRLLWRDDFVCVLRDGHPMARKRALSLDEWLALRHVLVAPRGTRGSLVDDVLAAMGRSRRVALIVPQFLLAPPAVAHSDLAWTAPASIARELAASHKLVIKPVPFEIDGFSLYLRWHDRFDRDPAHRWLRELLVDCTRTGRSRGAARS